MGKTFLAGFTILETMLFLAITGLLIVGMLSGVGVAVNSQRYRDAVQSLVSTISDQYGQLTNVQIDHNNSWQCDSNGNVIQGSVNSGEYRGQSNCIVLGRYMVINSTDISTESIIGAQISAPSSTGNDIDKLKTNYNLTIANVDTQTDQLQWSTKISWPGLGQDAHPAGSTRSIGILFITSPDSGNTYTFTIDSPPPISSTTSSDLKSFLVSGTVPAQMIGGATPRGQAARTICVDSNGLLASGQMAVTLQAYATNVTAIGTSTNDLLPGGQRC